MDEHFWMHQGGIVHCTSSHWLSGSINQFTYLFGYNFIFPSEESYMIIYPGILGLILLFSIVEGNF